MANSSRGAVLRAAWVVRGVCGHAAVLAAVAALIPAAAPAQQPRVLGIDVSAWQGSISQANWNTLKTVNQRDFVFIRSSRGGTT
ncbi:MAG TPA: hypothetical protein PJ982_19850, partial [Lacipirellulaceae bacterium]|nr:hypothetical protein [Lacipirellulaceae bacterium]